MKVNDKIGISISGGGHRATIFSLGALLYLVDSGRNRDVSAISSVSGGSLTNAFAALLPFRLDGKSFREIDSHSFELATASLAKQIAGDPRWWWGAVAFFFVFVTVWNAATIYFYPDLLASGWQTFALLVIFAWAFFIGPKSGGTLWSAWSTWLYVGLTAHLLLLACVLVYFEKNLTGYVLLLSALGAFGLRGRISELAMSKTMLKFKGEDKKRVLPKDKGGNKKRVLLKDISNSVRHVFCSTDLYTGQHVYFSQDMVFSDHNGIGSPGGVELSRIVQASANFPVAFPPIKIPTQNFQFKLSIKNDRERRSHLLLSDGGIRDNTGVSWFLNAGKYSAILKSRLNKSISAFDSDRKSIIEKEKSIVEKKVSNAFEVVPDQHIVISSSSSFSFKKPGNLQIPIWGELRALLKLPSLLYNNEGFRLASELRELFFLPEKDKEGLKGALVSIEESPFDVAQRLSLWGEHDANPEKADSISGYLLEKDMSPQMADAMNDIRNANSMIWQLVDSTYDIESLGYPSRKVVSPIIRKRATKVNNWLRSGPDLGSSREKLKSENDQLQRGLEELDEALSKVKEDKHREQKGLEARLEYARFILEQKQGSLESEDCAIRDKIDDWKSKYRRLAVSEDFRELEPSQERMSKNVPTTFRPLGRDVTAHLLWHGYLSMAVNGAIFQDYPLPDFLPELADFEDLADGLSRSSGNGHAGYRFK